MTQATPPVVVFDTGVILQAAINPRGPAADALDLLDQDRVTAYISPRLRSEAEDVLRRPSIRAKNPQITEAQIQAGLHRLDTKAVMVANPSSHFVFTRDPDDEPVINLAIEVSAIFLISRDKDLLDLMSDPDFRRRFPQLTILDPPAFLRARSSF